jgi:hypothetical protein
MLKNVSGIIFCIIFATIFIRSFDGISAMYKNQKWVNEFLEVPMRKIK